MSRAFARRFSAALSAAAIKALVSSWLIALTFRLGGLGVGIATTGLLFTSAISSESVQANIAESTA